MKIRTLAILFFLGAHVVSADTPAPPFAYIATSYQGDYYFLMLPKPDESVRYDNGSGVAYKVEVDGSAKELWRVDGWYSFKVYLSLDGRYLVRMGPWNGGSEPKSDHLAVAFYKEGKLIRKYSTAELVKNRSKVQASVSHYFWLARDDFQKQSEGKIDATDEPALGWDGIFRLKTIDGISYRFDVTSGEIIK